MPGGDGGMGVWTLAKRARAEQTRSVAARSEFEVSRDFSSPHVCGLPFGAARFHVRTMWQPGDATTA